MSWSTITTDSQITAIHGALLATEPDGVVLYYGDWEGSGPGGVQEITHGRLYRMAPGLAEPIEMVPEGVSPTSDCFCGGQSFLGDGRLLSAGGTFGWAQTHEGPHLAHYDGERRCWIYQPRANGWVPAHDLNFQPGSDSIGGGRWYPVLVTLANGEVFAVGGHPAGDDDYPPNLPDDEIRHNNNTPERYSAGANAWTLMAADITAPNGFAYATDSYPRFHLMPDGLLFSDTAGKDTGGGATSRKRLFDPFAGVWTGPDVGNLGTLPSYYDRGSVATSVLLPLLPPLYRARIFACNSDDATAFFIDVDSNPSWQETAERVGAAAGRRRDNGCATLLPTGQVFLSGGWVGNAGADDPDEAVLEPELYNPGINWDAGDFSGDEGWVDLSDDPALHRRGYHSIALLLPDGRVWHGGSTTEAEPANRNIDIYEPDYVGAAGRPTITSCPANIGYAMAFPVRTPQANSIARVALIRCGAITHGFNTDQRHVGLNFAVQDSDTIVVSSPPRGEIAPPGYYMLWLIDDQERVCERASFIRVSRQKLVISADISTYSIFEVDALGLPAQFNSALFVAADGFLPSEVTTPTYQLLRLDNSPVPGVTATFRAPKFEAGGDELDVAQRIVYPIDLRFNNTDAFDAIPDDQDFQNIVFYATMGQFVNAITLQLSKNPNPRMSDGDPPWLSVDLRVFKTNPGDTLTAGIEHPSANAGADGAYSYIRDVLAAYNDWDGGGHPFDALPTDQETNRLELGTNDVSDDPVFNYAIARVRFVAPEGIDAADVRVFFRMWTTGWTALEFDVNGSYRRFGDGPGATPLLGLEGGEINNIPCFAETRAGDMQDQTDNTNRRTLSGAGNEEVHAYFGCWLDINQDVARFPLEPSGDGPFNGDLLSIQELMRGLHQCLVAEIHYQLDPILPGATPSSSDNLAQRNILLDFSDNPGTFAAHLVHHTFELKPSPVSFEQSVLAPPGVAAGSTTVRLHPDELVIDWGELPRDSLVTFYMPQLNTASMVRANAARQAPANLKAVAPGTISCKVTEVGFMPIPGPLAKSIAGLISVQLPPGVPNGKEYRVVLRQVSGMSHKVLGTTEFRIKVSQAIELLPQFLQNFAVLKHIALSVPVSNRWYPIFQRYLEELGDRIRAFGGDPDSVEPSPSGHGRKPSKRPGRPELATFTGKVCRLIYGCFGEFEGFEVRDCDERKRFVACDSGVERVVLRACRDGLRLSVVYDPGTNHPKRLFLLCC